MSPSMVAAMEFYEMADKNQQIILGVKVIKNQLKKATSHCNVVLTSYLSNECTIIILICIETVSDASRFRDASINPLLPSIALVWILGYDQLGVFSTIQQSPRK